MVTLIADLVFALASFAVTIHYPMFMQLIRVIALVAALSGWWIYMDGKPSWVKFFGTVVIFGLNEFGPLLHRRTDKVTKAVCVPRRLFSQRSLRTLR
jgi:hypothetical protein